MLQSFAVLIFAVSSPIVLAQTPGAGTSGVATPSASPPFATTKVADNVYVFRYGGHQSMFVVTPEGVIATDLIAYLRPQAAQPRVEHQRHQQGGRHRKGEVDVQGRPRPGAVEVLLELLSSGMSIDEILADYEDLEREDILAALEFAARLSQIKRVELVKG